MPRKAPNSVQEMRLTLGDFERKLVTKQLDEDDALNKAKTYSQVGKSVAIGGAVVGGTIAAATLGTLALAAYREAAGLVDQAQDMKAGVWTMFKWRLGLASMDDLVADAQDYVDNKDERDAAAERRKNMGLLEYGLDRILVFLLGEDKEWTSTTLVKEEFDDSDPVQTIQEQMQINAIKDIESIWGSVENYQRLKNQKTEWQQMIVQFCNETSKDFDRDVCVATNQDYNEWKDRTIKQYGRLP